MTKLASRNKGGSRDNTLALDGSKSLSIDTAEEDGDMIYDDVIPEEGEKRERQQGASKFPTATYSSRVGDIWNESFGFETANG